MNLKLIGALGAVLLLTAAACGSDDDSGSATSAGVSATTESSASVATDSTETVAGDTTATAETTAASLGIYDPIPDGPIKVGVLLSLTGPQAATGTFQQKVYESAVEYVNEQGGIAGREIELLVENDQGDPAIAQAAAIKLVDEGVVAVPYPGFGAVIDQTVPIFMKEKIPVITTSTEYRFNDVEKFPYFFTNYATLIQDSNGFLGFAKAKGVTEIGYIDDGIPFSASLLEALRADYADTGVTVSKVVTIDPESVDLSTQILELKQSGVEAVVVGTRTAFGAIYDALNQNDWAPLVLVTGTGALNGVDKLGSLNTTTFAVCSIALEDATEEIDPQLDAVLKYFVDRLGETPVIGILPAYLDALLQLKFAIETANSLDPDGIKEVLETQVTDKSFSVTQASYTYTPTEHRGWALSRLCRLDVKGKYGMPIVAG